MTKEEKIAIMKDRYNKIQNSSKSTKSMGVVRKLKRQIRNMEN